MARGVARGRASRGAARRGADRGRGQGQQGRGAGRRGNSAAGRRGSPPGPGPSGTCPGSPPDGSPAGTVDSSGDVSRQQAAPRTRARMGGRGDVSRIAAGDHGRQQGPPVSMGAGVQGRGRGRRGSPPVKGQHVFISFGPDCFRRGSRATCPGGQQAAGAGDVSRGSRPPDGSRQAAGAARVQGQQAAGWIAAGSRGRPCPGAAGRRMDRGRQQGPPVSRGPDYFSGAAGRRGRGRVQDRRRMDRGRQQGPPVSRGPDYFSGAAGRRGRVHFDGRQGRGAPGQRRRDRAHAYTREHKTRVRPLPLKKIFLFPVGEYLARKTGVFPHGPIFCAMLFTSQGKRPAGDGGKPPKKFPEKKF